MKEMEWFDFDKPKNYEKYNPTYNFNSLFKKMYNKNKKPDIKGLTRSSRILKYRDSVKIHSG